MRRTARAQQNDHQQTTGVNIFFQNVRNRLHEGGMRAGRPYAGSVRMAQHSAAQLASVRKTPELAGPPLVPCSPYSSDQVHPEHVMDVRVSRGECCAACNIIQHDRLGDRSVKI